ncbi:hypothetical protein D1007_42865 [Hordeum vulgare]|nr:hypothetical protein D1007_42865 [Hordeum vulgare]
MAERSPAPRRAAAAPGGRSKTSLANENYMNTQESSIVKDSEVQIKINDRKAQLERSRIQRESDLNHFEGDTEVSEFCSDNLVHSDGSADEVVQMEIDLPLKSISDEEEEDEVDLPYLLKKAKSNKKKMKDRRNIKVFSYKDFEVFSLPQELPNKNYCLVLTKRAWV